MTENIRIGVCPVTGKRVLQLTENKPDAGGNTVLCLHNETPEEDEEECLAFERACQGGINHAA